MTDKKEPKIALNTAPRQLFEEPMPPPYLMNPQYIQACQELDKVAKKGNIIKLNWFQRLLFNVAYYLYKFKLAVKRLLK